MPGKTIFAVLFGVSLITLTYGVITSTRRGDASVPQQQVLASTLELSAGTLLRAQDIGWQPVTMAEADQIVMPSTTQIQAKPEIVEEMASSFYGAVLRHPLRAGTPIRRGDIVKPGDRDFLQVVLPPGARAIAIPVTTGGASTGLLTPGDRVDVVLTQNFTNTGGDTRNTPLTRRSVGETIVENIRVLAINAPDMKGSSNTVANGNFGRTVTLEVTPEQAETVNVAQELGKLTVTLRGNNSGVVSGVAASTDANGSLPDERVGIKPKWAGDVSPALLGAAQPKPEAIKPQPITVLRGGKGKEVVEAEDK